MVICPIAIAVHCTGCPLVKFCPAKTILGDYKEEISGMTSEAVSKLRKTSKDDIGSGEEPTDPSSGLR